MIDGHLNLGDVKVPYQLAGNIAVLRSLVVRGVFPNGDIVSILHGASEEGGLSSL
jgi:hypothetical protein